MKFNVKALALAAGALWGAVVFLTALTNLIWPSYGQACLEVLASVYPGYDAIPSFGQLIIGTGYGLVDGFIGGLVFGWLYNLFVAKTSVPAEGA